MWAQDPSPSIRSRTAGQRPDWERPVAALRDHIAAGIDIVEISPCLDALDSLAMSFETAYGRVDCTKPGDAVDQFIFTWFYRLRDEYIECLRRKIPHAVVVLAYVMVLLKAMDYFWFVIGWPEHIMAVIRGLLSEDLRAWLVWPEDQLAKMISRTNVSSQDENHQGP